jgi:hypothetical protein
MISIETFGKLKEAIVSDRVEPYFEQHRADFDAVIVSKGGELLRWRRREVAPEVRDALFSASAGAIVGPWRIERLVSAELDQPTRSEIHNQLFRAWLDEEWKQSNVEVTLEHVLGR